MSSFASLATNFDSRISHLGFFVLYNTFQNFILTSIIIWIQIISKLDIKRIREHTKRWWQSGLTCPENNNMWEKVKICSDRAVNLEIKRLKNIIKMIIIFSTNTPTDISLFHSNSCMLIHIHIQINLTAHSNDEPDLQMIKQITVS